MCNTVFINYLSNSLATSVNKTCITFNDLYNCRPLNVNKKCNIGPIQSGQQRNFIFEADIIDPLNFTIDFKIDLDLEQIPYTITKLNSISANTDIFNITQNDLNECLEGTHNTIFNTLISELQRIITDGMETMNHGTTCVKLNEFYNLVDQLRNMSNSNKDKQLFTAILNNVKHSDTVKGQIYKAFSNPDYYKKWGPHYLRYFLRSTQLQMCTNFKDDILQTYGGTLFNELRMEVEEIFRTIPTPKTSLSSTPYTGNFQQSTYTPSGPCFRGDGLVKMAFTRTIVKVENLKKGDVIKNSNGNVSTIICVIKTIIKNGECFMVTLPDGTVVTPYHPIDIGGGWMFPIKVAEPVMTKCEYIYNFVLDKHHIITINDVNGITLGHDIKDGSILEHPFFGTEKVIEHLKTYQGWNDGLILIDKYNPTYDENNMINTF